MCLLIDVGYKKECCLLMDLKATILSLDQTAVGSGVNGAPLIHFGGYTVCIGRDDPSLFYLRIHSGVHALLLGPR